MTTASSRHVQLGTVQLDLPTRSGPSSSSWPTSDSWEDLDTFFTTFSLSDAQWDLPPLSKEIVELLRQAADDQGLDLVGEWRVDDAVRVRVRIAVLPSDAKGAKWTSRSRGVLKNLMGWVRRTWDEHGYELAPRLLDRTALEAENMQELYASVPSPPEPTLLVSQSPTDQEMSESLARYENPQGVKTDLYRYQVRSVAKMIRMETEPERLVDPLWTPFEEVGREGTYYVNLATWDIQRCPGWYDLPRGGILCEQMGTGKTLMCLFLIVATLHQPTLPPPDTVEITSVTTDVAERTYPFTTYRDLRALSGFPQSKTRIIFPTLVELCANIIPIHDPSLARDASAYLPPGRENLLNRRVFFYHLPPQDDDCMRVAKKKVLAKQERAKVKKVYLAKTTLVVVPPILVQQWKSEIENHLEEGALQVLEVGLGEELPEITVLMEYDVVIMDINRGLPLGDKYRPTNAYLPLDLGFSAEATNHRFAMDLDPSVLLQARWKRIILDEGHVAKTKTSNAMALAIQLSVERRWLVTGTPTRHLQQGGEAELDAMTSAAAISAQAVEPTGQNRKGRAWSKRDLEDATRIGIMIGGFLAAEPFKSEGGFQSFVTAHLRKRNGPAFGAVARIKGIMDALFVKHGPRVIDEEARLPPLTLTKELLQFDPIQRTTYNVLAALISSNVLTSGGEDVDYLLHPNNVEHYNQVVNNLHLACFWYSAREMDAAGCLERTRLWLDRHPEADESVREHLLEACGHLQYAIDTPGWEEWMDQAISLPLDIPTLPNLIKSAWSDSFDTQPDRIDIHSLLLLREKNRCGASVQELHMAGWDHRAAKSDWFMEELQRFEKRHVSAEKKRLQEEEERHRKAGQAAQAPKAAPKLPRQVKAKNDKSRKRKIIATGDAELDEQLDEARRNAALLERASHAEAVIVNDDNNTNMNTDQSQSQHRSLDRPMPSIIRTRTKSAKVNFVLSAITASDPSDKFIIFGDNYELGHLTEALDLLDITSCFAGTTLSSKARRRALDNFEKPGVRVCLLDLKLGARGLNLIMANRMIFLAPVWNLDVQAQAIKRVHRIGQRRETQVQILITEGTFEEDIARRGTVHSSENEEEEKLYSREMIEHPRFVYPQKEDGPIFPIRFTPSGEAAPILPPPSSLDSSSSPSTSAQAQALEAEETQPREQSLGLKNTDMDMDTDTPTPPETMPITPISKNTSGHTDISVRLRFAQSSSPSNWESGGVLQDHTDLGTDTGAQFGTGPFDADATGVNQERSGEGEGVGVGGKRKAGAGTDDSGQGNDEGKKIKRKMVAFA